MAEEKAATIETETRYGKIWVFAQDVIASQSLVKYGEWAQNELNILAHFIRPGAIVVDGGGYIGSHSLAFSHFVGDHGLVHAFEPSAVTFEILSGNIRGNHRANVILHAQGLAAAEADLEMSPLDMEHGGNFGGASFHNHAEAAAETLSGEAHFVALDDILPHADFLKLDLEGMEVAALRGASRILRENRPHVFAECNSITNGVAQIAVMRPLGYLVFGCLVQAFNPDNFRRVAENMFGEAMEFGLVFVHASRRAEVAAAIDACELLEIVDEDTLAAYLFCKPQYPFEVLRQTPQWDALGLEARLRGRSQNELDIVQDALDRTQELALSRQAEIDKLQDALDRTQELARSRQAEIDKLRAALNETQAMAKARLRRIDVLQATIKDVEALASERTGQRDEARSALQVAQRVRQGREITES